MYLKFLQLHFVPFSSSKVVPKLVRIIFILFSFLLIPSLFAQSPWTQKADMPTARIGLSSSVINGKIYVMGGMPTGADWGDPSTPVVEVYDPITNNWDTTKAAMPISRNSFASSVVNDKIYVFGGQSNAGTSNLSSVIEYDPLTDNWTYKTPMPDVRAGLTSCVVNEKIYIIGGWKYATPGPYYNFREVWEYDPVTDTWDTNNGLMPTGREYLTSSVVDGKIYALGGWDENVVFKKNEMYNPATDTWATKADMPEERVYLKSGAVNNLIYILGGSTLWNVPPKSDTWEYDPATDTYKGVASMPMGVMHAAASEVNDKIYSFGGTISAISFPVQASTYVFEYNPLIDNIEKEYNYLPNTFSLKQNYPNPFNPSTTIEFSMPKTEFVTLKIYNLLGQEVTTLVSEKLTAGNYKYVWDAGSLSSGVYIYKIQAGSNQNVQKMVYMK